mmetsp:Transcript_587/g.1250  ORF Transcript_587/g.1250 Transcript_587/m.1250 type:complete len:209 (-) Transcript_587:93-719(-)
MVRHIVLVRQHQHLHATSSLQSVRQPGVEARCVDHHVSRCAAHCVVGSLQEVGRGSEGLGRVEAQVLHTRHALWVYLCGEGFEGCLDQWVWCVCADGAHGAGHHGGVGLQLLRLALRLRVHRRLNAYAGKGGRAHPPTHVAVDAALVHVQVPWHILPARFLEGRYRHAQDAPCGPLRERSEAIELQCEQQVGDDQKPGPHRQAAGHSR